jgi:hypothetical protein
MAGRYTVDIDVDIFELLKAEAKRAGETISQVANRWLRLGLAIREKQRLKPENQ